ncbi:sugar-binding domain-containing protein [Luteipulveratus sp. YIM 133132]|uniref:sugar-binding transcriptional regulator n=1 Tax=Luteipulveratus flavus TaxID=3031728 RepID=UPI0023B0A5B0|nr:sugar-binding domain-containing protein [Luteipulveratus sp. YIM 133132]MDE9367474.1 sugar-binding domain-containing protein [Luteipulveratus sp. YIM 133132]
MGPVDSADDRRLLATVARRYYLQDASKVQIAQELGLSRFKVARLLTEARDRGVVRIEIAPQAAVDTALSEQLVEHLGLRHAAVVDVPLFSDDAQAAVHLREEIGRTAAVLLHQVLGEGDVLGLPWSRTVSAMVTALETLPRVPVVQLSGALTVTDVAATPVDVVREAARLSGGPAHHFYAPLVAADIESARMMQRQPSVAGTFAHIDDVTVAVVGIGAWLPGESTIIDLVDAPTAAALTAAGTVGEISGAFIDAEGNAVDSELAQRLITVSVDQLRAVPHVIGLVTGPSRAGVVRAAVGGGLVDSLVTDSELATALLATEPVITRS